MVCADLREVYGIRVVSLYACLFVWGFASAFFSINVLATA